MFDSEGGGITRRRLENTPQLLWDFRGLDLHLLVGKQRDQKMVEDKKRTFCSRRSRSQIFVGFFSSLLLFVYHVGSSYLWNNPIYIIINDRGLNGGSSKPYFRLCFLLVPALMCWNAQRWCRPASTLQRCWAKMQTHVNAASLILLKKHRHVAGIYKISILFLFEWYLQPCDTQTCTNILSELIFEIIRSNRK